MVGRAVLGAPRAHEEHALRACYAALAMETARRAYAHDVRRTHRMACAYGRSATPVRWGGP